MSVVGAVFFASVRLFALDELNHHLEQMTGHLPASGAYVVTAEMGEGDGFTITKTNGVVTIHGESPRGALYGVYELLERFGGCGWYTPWRTVVPKRNELEVPEGIVISDRPAFAVRQPSWHSVRTNELFAARCRLNGEAPDGAIKHPNPKFGGSPLRFVRPLYSSHTSLVLVPPDVYFHEHPEYFSEKSGQRIADYTQLCMTNPEVVALVTKRALEFAAADPGGKIVGVSLMDWDNYCECAKCRAVCEREGSVAGLVMGFVNAVAEGIERHRPDLLVETLVYNPTRIFPKTVRPRKNVMLCICTLADYGEELETGTRPRNVAFRNDYEKWTACTRHLMQWDYTPNFLWFFTPHPNFEVYGPNLRYYRKQGVRYVYMDGLPLAGSDFADLRTWMLAKLMWNPDTPTDELVDRFMKGAYGKGAPFARAAYDRECAQKKLHPEMSLNFFHDDNEVFFPNEYFQEMLDLWCKAERAAVDDADALFALSVAKYPTLVALIMRLARQVPTHYVTAHPERWARPKELDELLAEEERIRVEMTRRGARPGYSLQRGLDNWVAQRLARLHSVTSPSAEQSVTIFPNCWSIHDGDYTGGEWNEKHGTRGYLVADDCTQYGQVVEIVPSSGYAVRIFLDDVAYDRDVPLKATMRVRMVGQAKASAEALTFRIQCGGKFPHKKTFVASELSSEWREVELGTFIPKPGMDIQFWGASKGKEASATVRIASIKLERENKQ